MSPEFLQQQRKLSPRSAIQIQLSKVNFASYSTGYGTLHTFLVITTLGVLQLDGILFLFMEISVTGVAPDKTTFFSRIKNVKKLELEPKLGKQ